MTTIPLLTASCCYIHMYVCVRVTLSGASDVLHTWRYQAPVQISLVMLICSPHTCTWV